MRRIQLPLRPSRSPRSTAVGIRVQLGPSSSRRVQLDTYRMQLCASTDTDALCAKALVNVTRQGKLAFHFVKASLPADYAQRYFARQRFCLTDTFTLPATIAQALGLSDEQHFLSPGTYRVVDLGEHLTVVMPLYAHRSLPRAVGMF